LFKKNIFLLTCFKTEALKLLRFLFYFQANLAFLRGPASQNNKLGEKSYPKLLRDHLSAAILKALSEISLYEIFHF